MASSLSLLILDGSDTLIFYDLVSDMPGFPRDSNQTDVGVLSHFVMPLVAARSTLRHLLGSKLMCVSGKNSALAFSSFLTFTVVAFGKDTAPETLRLALGAARGIISTLLGPNWELLSESASARLMLSDVLRLWRGLHGSQPSVFMKAAEWRPPHDIFLTNEEVQDTLAVMANSYLCDSSLAFFNAGLMSRLCLSRTERSSCLWAEDAWQAWLLSLAPLPHGVLVLHLRTLRGDRAPHLVQRFSVAGDTVVLVFTPCFGATAITATVLELLDVLDAGPELLDGSQASEKEMDPMRWWKNVRKKLESYGLDLDPAPKRKKMLLPSLPAALSETVLKDWSNYLRACYRKRTVDVLKTTSAVLRQTASLLECMSGRLGTKDILKKDRANLCSVAQEILDATLEDILGWAYVNTASSSLVSKLDPASIHALSSVLRTAGTNSQFKVSLSTVHEVNFACGQTKVSCCFWYEQPPAFFNAQILHACREQTLKALLSGVTLEEILHTWWAWPRDTRTTADPATLHHFVRVTQVTTPTLLVQSPAAGRQ